MKRMLVIILAALIALTACSQNQSSQPTTVEVSQSATVEASQSTHLADVR